MMRFRLHLGVEQMWIRTSARGGQETSRSFRFVATMRGRRLVSTIAMSPDPQTGQANILVLMNDPESQSYGLSLSTNGQDWLQREAHPLLKLDAQFAHCRPT